jgi:hypothetical protein
MLDFLPYNRGTNLNGHPDFAVFNGQYEEVTDSRLNLSGSKPLAIITARGRADGGGLEETGGFQHLGEARGHFPLPHVSPGFERKKHNGNLLR